MVLGGGQGLGMLLQQHGLIQDVAVGLSDADDVIHPGRRMHLATQGFVASNFGNKGLNRRNRHGVSQEWRPPLIAGSRFASTEPSPKANPSKAA